MKKVLLALVIIIPFHLFSIQLKLTKSEIESLKQTVIDSVELKELSLNWVRHVGKNSRLNNHGYGPKVKVLVLRTNKDKVGLGEIVNIKEPDFIKLKDVLLQRNVFQTLDQQKMLVSDSCKLADIPIYDLIGVILNKPVYKLFGKPTQKSVICYSGMIYMDDLEFENKADGIKKVLDNCLSDYNYGYRSFKIKIGRGGKWMEHEAGLQRDIEITNLIAQQFPDVTLLVDANDAYSVDDCIQYLDATKSAKIYWMEEPFKENEVDYSRLRDWQKKNLPDLLLADGEFKPIREELMDLGSKRLLDVYLQDMIGLGFTNWIEILPELEKRSMKSSPHNWGSMLRTIYTTHFALAFGNVCIVEGVTSTCNDLDLSVFKLNDGMVSLEEIPGFGIRLCK